MRLPKGDASSDDPMRLPKGDAWGHADNCENFDLFSDVEALRPQGKALSESASLPKGETPP